MPGVAESLDQSQLEASLKAGLDVISQSQKVVFTRYVKLILPLDNFVYWVKASIVTGQVAPFTLTVKGSLHRTTQNNQVEDATYGQNRIIFTSENNVDDFNAISPTDMWLGAIDDVRFSFNSSNMFYKQSGLYHYVGDAVYPFMESQIIDDANDLGGLDLVVSNSLPIWLTLNEIVPVYPSFLVSENIIPPYASVHIDPAQTTAIQSVPRIDETSSHWQLAQDHVRVTLYGLNNAKSLQFQDYILGYMADSDNLGLMNMPIVRDEKRPQSEINAIAMRKTIEFDVSYYQASLYDIARKFILSCIPTFTIGSL